MPTRLIIDAAHYQEVVLKSMLRAKVSLAIATADLKGMLIPEAAGTMGMRRKARRRGRGDEAPTVIEVLGALANQGVEVRVLHAGVPTTPALRALAKKLPPNLGIRRCPRLHAKTVIIDCQLMYLGSANLTGAGLGAKSAPKRNIEWGMLTDVPAHIDEIMAQFNSLWEGARCTDCGRKDVCPVPLEEPAKIHDS